MLIHTSLRQKVMFLLFFLFFMRLCTAAPILRDIDGQEIPFSALKGKWIVINYWASWCHPCLDEIPQLNQLHRQFGQKIALFAVNFDVSTIKEQKELIKKYQIEYPSLEDPSDILHLGDITGVPVTFIFKPDGQLKEALYGGQTLAKLLSHIPI